MQNLFGDATTAVSTILMYVVLFGGMYLLMFRPQQKKRKQEEQMRSSLAIGDEITTIGGIMGRVVSVRPDSDFLVIETASEKIKIKKWAVSQKES